MKSEYKYLVHEWVDGDGCQHHDIVDENGERIFEDYYDEFYLTEIAIFRDIVEKLTKGCVSFVIDHDENERIRFTVKLK